MSADTPAITNYIHRTHPSGGSIICIYWKTGKKSDIQGVPESDEEERWPSFALQDIIANPGESQSRYNLCRPDTTRIADRQPNHLEYLLVDLFDRIDRIGGVLEPK